MSDHPMPAALATARDAFPQKARPLVERLCQQAGMLRAPQWQALMRTLHCDPRELMLKLLPIARAFSRAPVSGFHVGAVVMADVPRKADAPALFLGANQEFGRHPLTATLHAEQAALLNAWHHDAHTPRLLAVSAMPCGYCRQIMVELADGPALTLLVPEGSTGTHAARSLDELLPRAIGPHALGLEASWMAAGNRPHPLQVRDGRLTSDPLVREALQAARQAHAPYSGNLAGLALETRSGRILSGRYLETMAFNPCCSPLQAALLNLALSGEGLEKTIVRAVLVEKSATIEQYGEARTLLAAVTHKVPLQHVPAD